MPRTVLMHANVQVPDDDGRPTPELVQAVEAALKSRSDHPPMKGLDIEIVMAEVIDDSGIPEWTARDEAARKAARDAYANDECEIDDGSRIVHLDEPGASSGAAWVQAWVYVDDEQIKAQL